MWILPASSTQGTRKMICRSGSQSRSNTAASVYWGWVRSTGPRQENTSWTAWWNSVSPGFRVRTRSNTELSAGSTRCLPIGSGSQGKPRPPRAVVRAPERGGTVLTEQRRQHARAEGAQLLGTRVEHALDLQARLLPGALRRADLRRCLPAHLAQVHEAVLEVPRHGDHGARPGLGEQQGRQVDAVAGEEIVEDHPHPGAVSEHALHEGVGEPAPGQVVRGVEQHVRAGGDEHLREAFLGGEIHLRRYPAEVAVNGPRPLRTRQFLPGLPEQARNS